MADTQLTPYRQKLNDMEATFSLALPKIAEVFDDPNIARRFQRIALAQFTPESKLFECSLPTLLGTLLECAELNLEPAVAGQCWMVPFKKKGRPQATLIVGYMGYKDLTWRHDATKALASEVVYDRDEFTHFRGFGAGNEPYILHPQILDDEDNADPGRLKAAYAVFQSKGGGTQIKVLGRPEVMARRKKSHARKDSAWITHEAEMWKKSAFRALYPMLPTTAQSRRAYDIDVLADKGKQNLTADPKDFGLDPNEWEDHEEALDAAKDVTPCGKPCGDPAVDDEPQECALTAGHDEPCKPPKERNKA